jgi:predicted PurR-regulated permease PerM
MPSGSHVGPDAPLTAVGLPGVKASFRSGRMPSRPFWLVLILGILAIIVFALSASALFVFCVGVALAFFLVPVVNWLQRRGWPRSAAAIAVVLVTLLGSVVLVIAVAAVLVSQGIAFLQAVPTYLDELGAAYAAAGLPDWLRSAIDSLISAAQEKAANVDESLVVVGVIGSVVDLVGGLFAWFLLPFFLFYLLKDQPRMSHSFYDRVPLPWKDDVSHILTITVGNFAQYFKAEFLVGGIMFVIVTIGMVVIGIAADAPLLVEFSLLLGAIAFVMELIPQIGPILSYIPALILAIASGPLAVVLVSIFYFLAFNVEGSILVPTFEGRMINFTGASVLVLIAIGFALAGIIGAILALPVASIVRDLFRLVFDKVVGEDLVLVPAIASAAAAGDAGDVPAG